MPATMDEYHLCTGKLLHHSAITDAMMFSVFQIFSGCELKIASAIFYTMDAFPTRKQMITRILKIKGDAEDKKYVEQIFSAAEKANNQRKNVAHSLAVFKDSEFKGNFEIHNPKNQDQTKKPATNKYLESLVRASYDAVIQGEQAFHKLCEKRGVPPIINL